MPPVRRLLLGLFAVTSLLAGCMSASKAPVSMKNLSTVEYVDLNRYMGDWHVIAHIPYRLEKGKVATTDRYALRNDGKIENTFLFRKNEFSAPEKKWSGIAWVTDEKTNAEWRVQFIWPLRSAYRVLELDADYRWAVVSSGDGDLVWILSRTRQLDDDIYARLAEKIRQRGIAAGKLAKVPQPRS